MPSPIAHSLMGAALNSNNSSLRGRQWTTMALFIFLANAPDLDLVPGLLRGNAFEFHRLVSHSFAFTAVSALLVYGVMRALRRPHAGRIAQAVVIGLLSHIALDYFCGGPGEGVAIFWPLSPERVSCAFRVFPGMATHGIIGLRNIEVSLIEISVMMILTQFSALHRLLSLGGRKPVKGRRASDLPKTIGLTTAAE